PRLKVPEEGAARDLAIRVLPREPDLEIVAFAGVRTDVPRAKLHGAVVEPEPHEDLLRVASQELELAQALAVFHEADELHLVELVLADEAARVLAVAAGL